ncbi:MAG: PLDc N-terminal domain-containing protein [Verrucomicrobia bacterium]|nr:PLDc N-terminal domain-containing protein [Verrucomicrobiota bacterium]
MKWIDWLLHGGWYVTATLTVLITLLASGHAVIRRRDSRSAVLWVIVICLMPLAGALLYLLLGINRIERRATALRRDGGRATLSPRESPCAPEPAGPCVVPEVLLPLANLVGQLVPRALLPGNRIEPLVNGERAYPSMLAAIEGARESLALATYIFDHAGIGEQFVGALGRAVARGVEVRVLLDDTDARFSWGSAARALRRAGVPVGVFNRTLVPARFHATHLRNHSKILVADGRIGFTGGINIATGYWHANRREECSRDLHFRLDGPVVAHLAEVFAADWRFATDEVLAGDKWFPVLASCGPMAARGIESGPDENFERLRWTIHGALATARTSVRIVTPYFLPDSALLFALNVAAMRGVEVDIVLPECNDLPPVRWAMSAQLWQVLERGCRVWLVPGPFDHSKLLLVDGVWSLFGSANWDARSLRLNFEFNVECYSAELGERLEALVESKRAAARRVTLAEMDARPLPVKLRDGIARLFAPYL